LGFGDEEIDEERGEVERERGVQRKVVRQGRGGGVLVVFDYLGWGFQEE